MERSKRHALLWAAFFLFLVGFMLHIRQMFYMSAAAAMLWPISLLLGRRKLAGLELSRSAPKALQAGEAADVKLRLINPTRTKRLFVQLTDALPAKAAGVDPSFIVPNLEAGAEVELSYVLRTSLRGVYRLGPLLLQAAETLGLSTFSRQFEQSDEVIVYPTPVPLPPLWPPDAAGHRPHRALRVVGDDGLDFYGIREYVPGDDLRRVHWKTTARMDELMTVQFTKEQSLEGTIILDLHAKSHAGEGLFSTLEQGVLLAATAARQADVLAGDVGLIAVGDEDYSVPVALGLDQYRAILEGLARAEPTQADNWPDAVVQRTASRPPRGAALVISPRTDEIALTVAGQLLARDQVVSWMVLEPAGATAAAFVAQLQSLGCRVRTIDCSLPLQAQFGIGQRFYAQT